MREPNEILIIDLQGPPARFGRCYECAAGRHAECIGVPCDCPCPLRSAMPGYWRAETSGLLAPAVSRFLAGAALSEPDLALLRAYLRQWMDAPFAGPGIPALRRQIDGIRTPGDLEHWLSGALAAGIDPF